MKPKTEPSQSGLKPQSLPRSSVDTRIGSDDESPKDSEIVEKVLSIDSQNKLYKIWGSMRGGDMDWFDFKEAVSSLVVEARKDCEEEITFKTKEKFWEYLKDVEQNARNSLIAEIIEIIFTQIKLIDYGVSSYKATSCSDIRIALNDLMLKLESLKEGKVNKE